MKTAEVIIDKMYDRIAKCMGKAMEKESWKTKMLTGVRLVEGEKCEEADELWSVIKELEDMIDWIEGKEPREDSPWTREEWATYKEQENEVS